MGDGIGFGYTRSIDLSCVGAESVSPMNISIAIRRHQAAHLLWQHHLPFLYPGLPTVCRPQNEHAVYCKGEEFKLGLKQVEYEPGPGCQDTYSKWIIGFPGFPLTLLSFPALRLLDDALWLHLAAGASSRNLSTVLNINILKFANKVHSLQLPSVYLPTGK